MESEDPQHLCEKVSDAPPGAWAISGVNSAAFPGEFEAIAALAQNERALAVEQFYERNFWKVWYAQLTSDEVAKRVFDAAVNAGSVASVRCLQEAVNSFPIQVPLVEDGVFGPQTVAKANILHAPSLVSNFCARRVAYYQAIVAAHPEDAQYLKAWTARAQR
jgi:lysozyme family protein